MAELSKSICDDMLGRQPFITQIIQIIKLLSVGKKNSCFAINGKWGVGKTFVLNSLEKQLSEEQQEATASNQFIVFHYNCWQYDYYDEPLIAIVAALIDEIDNNINLLSEDKREWLKNTLKFIGNKLFLIADEIIESKTGISIQEARDAAQEIGQQASETIKNNHNYDDKFHFTQTLKKLQDTIASLSQTQTVIIVVDELDRCLPAYCIKVLERLHHVFYDIENVQVIMAIDKTQLKYSVKQIYGESTDVNKYLAKFLNFELKLDEGKFKDNFSSKFTYYLDQFEYCIDATKQYHIDDFTNNIFNDIDMRSRISIIEKCSLIHNIVNVNEEKYDISYMCIEIFLSLIDHIGFDYDSSKPYFNIEDVFGQVNRTFSPFSRQYEGLQYLSDIYKENHKNGQKYYWTDEKYSFVKVSDIWGLILAVYRYILGCDKDNWYNSEYNAVEIKKYINIFYGLLKVIK